MKKTFKIIVIILGVLFFIGLLGSIFDKSKPSSDVDKTENQKKWTVVYEFKGNGMKKSPAFELTGNSAKIKYKYKSSSSDIGVFAVYVVDDGDDIMKTGGIPDVMTQSVNEESEGSIQKTAGKYYLNVNGVGKWTVTVEEER